MACSGSKLPGALWRVHRTFLALNTFRPPQHFSTRVMHALPRRNEIIMAFLWGMGEDGPLRYRLLPVASYANIGARSSRGTLISVTQWQIALIEWQIALTTLRLDCSHFQQASKLKSPCQSCCVTRWVHLGKGKSLHRALAQVCCGGS